MKKSSSLIAWLYDDDPSKKPRMIKSIRKGGNCLLLLYTFETNLNIKYSIRLTPQHGLIFCTVNKSVRYVRYVYQFKICRLIILWSGSFRDRVVSWPGSFGDGIFSDGLFRDLGPHVTGSFRVGKLCDGKFCDGSSRDGTFCMWIITSFLTAISLILKMLMVLSFLSLYRK
jgi:hypothetical protein